MHAWSQVLLNVYVEIHACRQPTYASYIHIHCTSVCRKKNNNQFKRTIIRCMAITSDERHACNSNGIIKLRHFCYFKFVLKAELFKAFRNPSTIYRFFVQQVASAVKTRVPQKGAGWGYSKILHCHLSHIGKSKSFWLHHFMALFSRQFVDSIPADNSETHLQWHL